MAHFVKITTTGKVRLTDASGGAVGRVLVHIRAADTINMTFVGRPRCVNDAGTEQLAAADDVTLGYYTPESDSLATTAISNAGTVPVQVSVKADGNIVYANVASVTGTAIVWVVPLVG